MAELVSEIELVSEVFVANDFDNGYQSIETNSPQLVLLDIHLGEKNGIDLLKIIKQKYSSIRVIIVSNKASQYYRDLSKENGCDYFIDKSKEFEKIPSVINSFFITS